MGLTEIISKLETYKQGDKCFTPEEIKTIIWYLKDYIRYDVNGGKNEEISKK
jgi:hypothetical protein